MSGTGCGVYGTDDWAQLGRVRALFVSDPPLSALRAREELQRALNALRLEVAGEIVDDLEARITSAIRSLILPGPA